MKKSKHIPIRTCVACGGKKNKKEMLRVVKSEDSALFDEKQRESGRGFYICKDLKCIKKKKKNKRNALDAESAEHLKKHLDVVEKEKSHL